MRNIPHSVPQHGMLYGIGVIGDGSAFQVDRRLDGIDLGARENNIVIDHVVPGVSIFDMVGINRIGHDVGEGFLRVFVQTGLAQGRGVLVDCPDLQIGRAVQRVQRSGNKLQASVVIQICNGIVPGVHAIVLLQTVNLGSNQLELFLGRCSGTVGKCICSGAECQ